MPTTGTIVLEKMSDGLERSGAQISAVLNIGSGKLYPTLARLERDLYLSSRWADEPRPRRRLYKITPAGLTGIKGKKA